MSAIRIVLLSMLCIMVPALATASGNIESGAELAINCGGCHGENGISPNEFWPNLAGQQTGWFIKQMKAYRDGTLPDPIMQTFAQSLNDQDIEDLAAYYAQLDCQEDTDENE